MYIFRNINHKNIFKNCILYIYINNNKIFNKINNYIIRNILDIFKIFLIIQVLVHDTFSINKLYLKGYLD